VPPASTLLDLLLRVGHVGEVHRLLHILRQCNHPVGPRELVHLVHETAGWAPRYPRPQAALALAERLGFIRIQHSKVSISNFGRLFLPVNPESPVDLDKNQGKVVLAQMRNDRQFDGAFRSLLPRFHETATGAMMMSKASDLGDIEACVLRLLQQLKCVIDSGEVFVIDSDFELSLLSDTDVELVLTEEGLWKRLENQRLRARHIETLIVEFEKQRLIAQGRTDLAEAVLRVSENNVSAGYDIASFEMNGDPRFVEVKSSVSSVVQFHWSDNERKLATEIGSSYWIYFVPFSEMCTQDLAIVLLIQNPAQELRSGRIIEFPNSWRVNSATPHQSLSSLLPKCITNFKEIFAADT
jgi:hypothetical protein